MKFAVFKNWPIVLVVAAALTSTHAAADPPFKPPNFWDSYANGIVARHMTRQSQMAYQAVQLLEALKPYPPGTAIPADNVDVKEWWRFWKTNFFNDDLDGSGFTWSYKDIPYYTTARDYRFALRLDVSVLTRIKDLEDYWERNGGPGEHAPFYDPEAVAIFDAIQRMDPETGQIDGDVPPKLRATQ